MLPGRREASHEYSAPLAATESGETPAACAAELRSRALPRMSTIVSVTALSGSESVPTTSGTAVGETVSLGRIAKLDSRS